MEDNNPTVKPTTDAKATPKTEQSPHFSIETAQEVIDYLRALWKLIWETEETTALHDYRDLVLTKLADEGPQASDWLRKEAKTADDFPIQVDEEIYFFNVDELPKLIDIVSNIIDELPKITEAKMHTVEYRNLCEQLSNLKEDASSAIYGYDISSNE